MLNEGNQINNLISSSGSGTVINYHSGSDFLTSYGSGSTSQKVTVPTVPVPVPQRWLPVPGYLQHKTYVSITPLLGVLDTTHQVIYVSKSPRSLGVHRNVGKENHTRHLLRYHVLHILHTTVLV
jgi:hypothetical protein